MINNKVTMRSPPNPLHVFLLIFFIFYPELHSPVKTYTSRPLPNKSVSHFIELQVASRLLLHLTS